MIYSVFLSFVFVHSHTHHGGPTCHPHIDSTNCYSHTCDERLTSSTRSVVVQRRQPTQTRTQTMGVVVVDFQLESIINLLFLYWQMQMQHHHHRHPPSPHHQPQKLHSFTGPSCPSWATRPHQRPHHHHHHRLFIFIHAQAYLCRLKRHIRNHCNNNHSRHSFVHSYLHSCIHSFIRSFDSIPFNSCVNDMVVPSTQQQQQQQRQPPPLPLLHPHPPPPQSPPVVSSCPLSHSPHRSNRPCHNCVD